MSVVSPRGRVLWVDDDGANRFLFEQMELAESGWLVDWAEDMDSAASCLRKQAYSALFLDQMMPIHPGGYPNIWAGCVLLHWLRGVASPTYAPGHVVAAETLKERPLRSNSGLDVLVISAYVDEQVFSSLRKASPKDSDLAFIPKPTEPDRLLSFLGELDSRLPESPEVR